MIRTRKEREEERGEKRRNRRTDTKKSEQSQDETLRGSGIEEIIKYVHDVQEHPGKIA